jgi:hypothetical protein
MARIPAALRQAVIESAQGRCAYCRTPERLMGVTFEIEHVVPRSARGRTQAGNLCFSCPTCNRCKANRLSASDPEARRSARLFHPNRDQWSEHFAWSPDGSQILGLTPTGRATARALRFNRPVLVALRQYWRATGIRLEE